MSSLRRDVKQAGGDESSARSARTNTSESLDDHRAIKVHTPPSSTLPAARSMIERRCADSMGFDIEADGWLAARGALIRLIRANGSLARLVLGRGGWCAGLGYLSVADRVRRVFT